MREIYDEILKYTADEIKNVLMGINRFVWETAEEIRIFSERHIIIYTNDSCLYVTKSGEVSKICGDLFVPSKRSLEKTISLMCNNSIYSELDNIKNGFITLVHGHRVGIVGTAVLDKDKISYIRNISCINIRIMREAKGFSEKVINRIIHNNIVKNTLIISPPQCGKTTLIRDIARVIGGIKYCKKIGIVDERNEIASVAGGKIINDIGVHTFVINNCPKNEGLSILIRTMSPEVIITDEIGSSRDAEAMKKAICCGVKIITTVHAGDEQEFVNSEYGRTVKDLFDIFIVLSRRQGPGTVEKIIESGDICDN